MYDFALKTFYPQNDSSMSALFIAAPAIVPAAMATDTALAGCELSPAAYTPPTVVF
jgi:hypothetical protein